MQIFANQTEISNPNQYHAQRHLIQNLQPCDPQKNGVLVVSSG